MPQDIASRIRSELKASELSLREIARRADVPVAALSGS